MNLRDLEYLVALDDHRHFGRAAASVYVSQPTLSTQIKKLEAELGVALVERGRRSVMLTAIGERVVRRARHVLADVEEINTLARQARNPHTGRIRLGAFPTLAPYVLPHVLGPLTETFPDLELLLVEEKSPTLLRQVRDGQLDAALIALPVTDESLHVEPLFVEDFVLAVPRGHHLADSSTPIATPDLAGEDLMLLSEGHCLREQALDVCGSVGAHERRGFQATSLETLRHMVAAGSGITLMPRLATVDPVPHHPRLVMRDFAEPPSRTIAMMWRHSHVDQELLVHVAATLREAAHSMPVHPVGL